MSTAQHPPVEALRSTLYRAVHAAREGFAATADRGPSGERVGQYAFDLVTDEAVIDILTADGLGVLSEEAGEVNTDRPLIAVVDPLDGSTNASRGLPWYATSICVVDDDGPLVAVVVNHVSGRRYDAVRGGGARADGRTLTRAGAPPLHEAIVAISGMPPRPLGWRQFRALGAVALDVAAVADGSLDASVDCSVDAHGSWDYLAATLICHEAGAAVADAWGRDLVVLDHDARRTPVAAGSDELLEALLAERAAAFGS
ncbi:MAG: hypothetical protein HKN26_12080 [Acidimicrobiales bacterium]|nr:hypothetical protein [Acidimicrobiales bacterium]